MRMKFAMKRLVQIPMAISLVAIGGSAFVGPRIVGPGIMGRELAGFGLVGLGLVGAGQVQRLSGGQAVHEDLAFGAIHGAEESAAAATVGRASAGSGAVRRCRKIPFARASRLMIVPTGTSISSAISL